MIINWKRILAASLLSCLVVPGAAQSAESKPAADQVTSPRACIDGTGPGWAALTLADFVNVNCNADTWTEKEGVIHGTGKPTGVTRSKVPYTNFELVAQWRHLRDAGNSGFFVWATPDSLAALAGKPGYPVGIEVQVLDLGYTAQYEKQYKKKADWFTCHGDVFPVGTADMKPFPPVAPDGKRSFPTKHLSKGVGEWNHYYVRGINGEIRLWVNGEEVSGGTDCQPRTGFLCLESEGSPVEFKNLRIRVLP